MDPTEKKPNPSDQMKEYQSLMSAYSYQQKLNKEYKITVTNVKKLIQSTDQPIQPENPDKIIDYVPDYIQIPLNSTEKDEYHMKICFEDLMKVKDGVMIEENVRDFGLQGFDQIQLIGVMGKYKIGKTFFIEKLTGKRLASDFKKKTKGICIAKGREKSMQYFVDVQGCGEPLQVYKRLQEIKELISKYASLMTTIQKCEAQQPSAEIKKLINEIEQAEQQIGLKEYPIIASSIAELRESLHQRSEKLIPISNQEEELIRSEKSVLTNCNFLSEAFINQFLHENCPIKVVVVGILTNEDQKYINMMIDRMKSENDAQQSLFIIHNFYTISQNDVLKYYIQKDLIGSFDCSQELCREEDMVIYQDEMGQVIHGVMANDLSPLGQRHNAFLVNNINQILASKKFGRQVNIIEEFKEFLNTKIGKYLEIEYKQQILPSTQKLDFEYDLKRLVSKTLKQATKIIPRVYHATDMNDFIRNQVFKEESAKFMVDCTQEGYEVKLEIINFVPNSLEVLVNPYPQTNILYLQVKAKRKNLQGETINVSQVIQVRQNHGGQDTLKQQGDYTYNQGILTLKFELIRKQDLNNKESSNIDDQVSFLQINK